jgi:cytochrome b involved in lipid metabolism
LDSCLQFVDQHRAFDPDVALEFFVKFSGITKKTPRDRIRAAIGEELLDLCTLTLAALAELPPAVAASPLGAEAAALLSSAIQAGARWDYTQTTVPDGVCFPREALESVRTRAAESESTRALASSLGTWIDKHRALERRLHWMMNGTRASDLAQLDPVKDCDQIAHAMSSWFRVETRVLELLAINRIAQSSTVSLFFRGTKEAETNGVNRFYDTWSLLANFFEWGEDSRRGRETVDRLKQIHGRYYIPNDGMKYVLLGTAFTWLDGADRIAHRPLLDIERKAFAFAYVKLGLAMNIGELSYDYDAMYGWYRDFNRANANYQPIKKETFETIIGNSIPPAAMPQLRPMLLTAARVAMDDTYLSAVGYEPAPPAQQKAVRAVFFTLGQMVESLPYTPFIRSLQNNPARKSYTRPGQLGVHARSTHMPMADQTKPNAGFPERQAPVLPSTDPRPMNLPLFTWDEIATHNTQASLWTVIEGEVYDLTVWAPKHPGGLQELLDVAGKDGTAAFQAAQHPAAVEVFKLNYRIGRVAPRPARDTGSERGTSVAHTI